MDHNHKVSGKSERVTTETFEKLGDLILNDSLGYCCFVNLCFLKMPGYCSMCILS